MPRQALKQTVKYNILEVGFRADTIRPTVTEQLREMTRAADPVGEMTRQLQEAQAVARPMGILDCMKALPETVASSPRKLLDMRSAVEDVMNPGGAYGAALRDFGRLNRLLGR